MGSDLIQMKYLGVVRGVVTSEMSTIPVPLIYPPPTHVAVIVNTPTSTPFKRSELLCLISKENEEKKLNSSYIPPGDNRILG